jgi:hypothetical protein
MQLNRKSGKARVDEVGVVVDSGPIGKHLPAGLL